MGERFIPARARPVPFCFQGLIPEPATSPLVLLFALLCLAFANATCTASNMVCGCGAMEKISPFKVSEEDLPPFKEST